MTDSGFIHITANDSISFLFMAVYFHCMYVLHLLYPFICLWTSRLLSCSVYCKQCFNEHWGTCVFFQFWFPQDICLVVKLLSHMLVLFLVFKGISVSSIIHNGYINLHPRQQCKRVSFSPHFFQHLLFVDFLIWPF